MKRIWRILLNLFAPPLICSLLLVSAMFVFDPSMRSKPLTDCMVDLGKGLVLFLLFAYVIAIIPSALHSFVMEKAYLKFPAHTWSAVVVSGFSGSFAGLIITAFLARPNRSLINFFAPELYLFIGLGLCVGLILGTAIKFLSHHRPTP